MNCQDRVALLSVIACLRAAVLFLEPLVETDHEPDDAEPSPAESPVPLPENTVHL
jgi:hypothetical protein